MHGGRVAATMNDLIEWMENVETELRNGFKEMQTIRTNEWKRRRKTEFGAKSICLFYIRLSNSR